jgi:hypothetical protein
MADYNNNYGLKQFLITDTIVTNTSPDTPQNTPKINEIFDTVGHNLDRRIFLNNKRDSLRFPIIPRQMIDGVDVDMGLQESLCKKVFADIMTNFISSEKSFTDANQQHITRFQLLVNKTFTTAITKYKTILKKTTHPNILQNDILFIYKGGTTMKLLFDKYDLLFRNLYTFRDLKSFFARSDSDYSIFIKPTLANFNEIYMNINQISTCCLLFIKQQIIDHPDFFVPLRAITPVDIRGKIEKMNSDLNKMKTNPEGTPYCNKVRNIDRFIGIGYFNNNEFTEEIPALNNDIIDTTFSNNDIDSTKVADFIRDKHIDTKRSDFFMTYEDGNFEQKVLGTLSTPPNDIYLSLNETNEYPGKEGTMTAFCLHRLKINFVAYYKTIPDEHGVVKYGYFSCPSELVDVSIMKSVSNDLQLIYKNIDYEFTNYNYHLKKGMTSNNELKIIFKSYSIYGHISDLCLVLFVQNDRPWQNSKYAKRINRLLYFLVLEIISMGKKKSILNAITLFNKLINDAITLNTFTDDLQEDIFYDISNNTIPKLHKIFESAQINFANRPINPLNIHFASIKFLDYYLKLLQKINLNDPVEMKSFTDFNTVIIGFIKIILKTIHKMKKFSDEFFGSIATSPDGTLNLRNLGGGNDDEYKEKYLKYKVKYLKLKDSL